MPSSFADLSPDDFPFTIHYIDAATDEVMESITITEPGALYVPPRDRPTNVRIDFADGTSTYQRHDALRECEEY